MTRVLFRIAVLMVLFPMATLGQERPVDPTTIPSIKAFLGDGFGTRHKEAPDEVEQFGRLVGVWQVETEMARQSGGWVKTEPGLWIWKYAIGGFAVSDLWYQGADRLPAYMASLGRDYLLTANRIYDVGSKQWKVAWIANGAGKTPGADFGTFSAQLEDEAIVMRSPADDYGLQRVVFSDFTDSSFRWTSEFSTDDGKTWNTVMRMQATRFKR